MPPQQDDDDALEVYWDDVQLARVRQPLPDDVADPVPNFGDLAGPGDFVIGTSKDRVLVIIRPNGQLEYGPEYRPDEAAMVFWENMGQRKLMMDDRLLVIGHMEAVLVRLGVADLEAQRLRELAQNESNEEARPRRIHEADVAVRRLEQVANQAIELGRALVRRPDIPMPAVPPSVPTSIQQNPNSEYQGREGLPELPGDPARS
jgi:hypothetical protein